MAALTTPEPQERMSWWPATRLVDLLAIVAGVAAVAAAALDAPAGVRIPAVLAGFLLLPGWALVRLLFDVPTWLGLSIAVPLSLALETLGSLVMVWTHSWHPSEAAVVLAVASGLVLAAALLRRPYPEADRLGRALAIDTAPALRGTVATAAAVMIAIALWMVAVRQTDTTDLRFWGLLPELGPAYYAALAILVLTLVWGLTADPVRWPRVALPLAGLIVVLYATAPAVEDAPRYSYVYKHMGVTRYIEAHGGVDASIDIYHRWPGFFTLAAWFSSVAGQENPLPYAPWAEVLFILIPALLTWTLAKVLTDDSRLAWTAAAVFLCANWVGQNYFAPQSSAYVLLLTIALMATLLMTYRPTRLGRFAERLVGRLLRVRASAPPPTPPAIRSRQWSIPRGAVIVVLLCADAALVATHQLTPMAAVVAVSAFAVTGYLRPQWVAVAVIAITAAYLVPNLKFLEGSFGLYSSFNPLANASHTTHVYGQQVHDKVLQVQIAQALVLAVWGLALISMVLQARAGHLHRMMVLGLWTWSPLVILGGQDYGGEARLRVFLYSLPFAAIAIAWLFHAGRLRRLVRAIVVTSAFGLILAGFLASYLGREDIAAMPAREVAASQWIHDHAPDGSVLMLSVPNFPTRYGADYDKFVGPNGEDTPNLLLGSSFADRPLRPATSEDIDVVVSTMRQYSRHGYIVFSTSQLRMARAFQIFGDGGLDRLEAGVRASPRFKLIYGNRDARLYELVDEGRTP